MSTTKKPLLVRAARATARNPYKCVFGTLITATLFSAIGIVVGKFEIAVDNAGWRSRGTLISNREMQNDLLLQNVAELFQDTDGSTWEYLENTLSRGYVELEDRDSARRRTQQQHNRLFQTEEQQEPKRSLSTCDTDWYGSTGSFSMYGSKTMYAIYKVEHEEEGAASFSILDKEVMSNICEAETNTLQTLQNEGLCDDSCDDGTCLPPHSLLLVLRNYLQGGVDMTCSQLMDAYTSNVQADFTQTLVECTVQLTTNFDQSSQKFGDISSCPLYMEPHLVDVNFALNGNDKLRYTSSFFPTSTVDPAELYKRLEQFDDAGGVNILAVYDTMGDDFNTIFVDALVISDMALAVASMTVTFLAMGVHTRSFWLTFMGIFQIIYAIPLAYFVYTFIANLNFFPFLNFIGVFVAAALGADDLFVAVDKWKNARIANPTGSVEDIAEVALPDAAGAMLLTTSTTAVAFFATCICPVPPILCFAVFCGLMIIFNYTMNVLLVFPALCLYDRWIEEGKANCLVACCIKKRGTAKDENENTEDFKDVENHKPSESKLSFIHRILTAYYNFIHKFRWPVLAIMVIATIVSIYFALALTFPESTEVRLLPESHPIEYHFNWRNALLSSLLFSSGTGVKFVFGLTPGDTGRQNDPDQLSKLLIDKTFDASSQEAQQHLVGFCARLYANDFAELPFPEYVCAINAFDSWLQEQSSSGTPDAIYSDSCNGADSLPMASESFDACLTAWSSENGQIDVLDKNGKIQVITIKAKASVRFDASQTLIDKEWNAYEAFVKAENKNAPEGVNKAYTASPMWWWYDTNFQMFQTAVGAAGIAIAFSAIIVLMSSRSLVLTLFSGCCILYVLAAATASLVGLGWSLGFLESVCFAILVGISCDFVIHFGHAYIFYEGAASKHERAKYAVIHMGPSILAAAFTTISAAIVMFFCKVIFFTKFAMILFMTIIHATIGSFVVYIVLSDLFGPSEPTKFINNLIASISGGKKEDEDTDENVDVEDLVLVEDIKLN